MRTLSQATLVAILIFQTTVLATTEVSANSEAIKIADLGRDGLYVLEDYKGDPGETGVFDTFRIEIPPRIKGSYFAGKIPAHFPDICNRMHQFTFESGFPGVSGGQFIAFLLADNRYLTILPMVNRDSMAWLNAGKDNVLDISIGNFGTDKVSGDVPLFAWSVSDDVYESCYKTWKHAMGERPMRSDKQFPEMFKYLGWCSWEQYRLGINSKLLVDAARKIDASGVPVRFMLVDDGHQSQPGKGDAQVDGKRQRGSVRQLVSFDPAGGKFPNGWKDLLAIRNPDRIKWMGLWHCYFGHWAGIAKNNKLGESVNKSLQDCGGTLLPGGKTMADALTFQNALIKSVKDHGFDFVKIDVQTRYLRNLKRQVGNPVLQANNMAQALETAAKAHAGGLINCMAQNNLCVFNTRYSNITRGGNDYHKNSPGSAINLVWQVFSNAIWQAQTVWVDHDMFHCSDEECVRMTAVTKAISGGPVYLSDSPDQFIRERVMPLCYADGRLLRPLAPGVPLPESLFNKPRSALDPFRVIAPLPHDCAAIAVYNVVKQGGEMTTSISPGDYRYANAMIQPYPGLRKISDEGLVAYDVHAGTCSKLTGEQTVDLTREKDRLYILTPIRKGWAVIGRTDKYLGPSSMEKVVVTKKQLKITLIEAGPFAVWLKSGKPRADGIEFTDAGNGLWKADLPVGPSVELSVSVEPSTTSPENDQ